MKQKGGYDASMLSPKSTTNLTGLKSISPGLQDKDSLLRKTYIIPKKELHSNDETLKQNVMDAYDKTKEDKRRGKTRFYKTSEEFKKYVEHVRKSKNISKKDITIEQIVRIEDAQKIDKTSKTDYLIREKFRERQLFYKIAGIEKQTK